MSEYQYYEFQAIDRPLDAAAMAALRAITSRAEITSTHLVNVYHFGDFKGDPARLMEQYFDAHLYLANWGTRRLMLRLPAHGFPLSDLEPYLVDEYLHGWASHGHVILDFTLRGEPDDWDDQGGEGWLSSLVLLRHDLLAGDLRALYLGWLTAVEAEAVEADTLEPPVPPGLGRLNGPLRRLADFLRLDPALIQAAASGSPEAELSAPATSDLAAWISRLPADQKNGMILRLVQGEAGTLGHELIREFRKDAARRQIRSDPRPASEPRRRTVAELLEARDRRESKIRREQERKAAAELARRAREQAQARTHHLDGLAGHEDELRREVEALVETKQPRDYDRAVTLLRDLHDLAERTGTVPAWARFVAELRERHRLKRTWIARLDRAGLSHGPIPTAKPR